MGRAARCPLDARRRGPGAAAVAGSARRDASASSRICRAAYAGARCAVVPLLQGGGTPLKLIEALAYGLPVIATPRAAAGLGRARRRALPARRRAPRRSPRRSCACCATAPRARPARPRARRGALLDRGAEPGCWPAESQRRQAPAADHQRPCSPPRAAIALRITERPHRASASERGLKRPGLQATRIHVSRALPERSQTPGLRPKDPLQS